MKEILAIIKKIRCSVCEDHCLSSYEKIKDNILSLIEEGNKAEDIAVMVPYRWEVDQLSDHLKDEDFRTICVSTRKNKVNFDRNDEGVKISTINSFKGYELSNIIILTEHNNSNLFGHEILYTSLTRTTNKLVILNRNEDYSQFSNYLEDYKNSLLVPE